MSENLLKHFGTIRQIVAATDLSLSRALEDDPDVAQLIIVGRAFNNLACRESIVGEPVSVESPEFLRFLVGLTKNAAEEQCHVIYLDRSRRFLTSERVGNGSRSAVQIKFRSLFGRAMELGACGMIVVHNHPSGNVKPSSQDIQSTKELAHIAKALSIDLVDHCIVAGSRVLSMKGAGFL